MFIGITTTLLTEGLKINTSAGLHWHFQYTRLHIPSKRTYILTYIYNACVAKAVVQLITGSFITTKAV